MCYDNWQMSGKKLIIVESPTKSRTLTRFLGNEYQVMATMGHIRDLPSSRLAVDVKHDFKPEYVWLEKKKETVDKLKQAIKKASQVFLAVDPDREGEAIAWHAAALVPGAQTQRITFHEITQSAIKAALTKPGKINMKLVNAQQARRILDRLVGYELSPLLWRKIRRGLSAGRVQSVAVRLIVDREREIEAFKAQEYWEILAELSATAHPRGDTGRHPGGVLMAKLVKINNQKAELKNQSQTKKAAAELKKAVWQVDKIKQRQTAQHPAPPLTTSTMQQKASQAMRFTGRRTMRIAQSLYEKGLITYHRTDSVALAAQAVDKIRDYINSIYGQSYLPDQPRFYKTKSKLAQEAHEAIRPTKMKLASDSSDGGPAAGGDSSKVLRTLNRDEKRLYQMIFNRAIACQMKPALWQKTRVDVGAQKDKNHYQLKTEGKILEFDGWLKLYGQADKGEELPKLKENQALKLLKLDPQQKFTQPPARYTEATLIKALEERGIGRPSTYAPIASTIQARQYVEKEEAKFKPTVLGITVNDFLIQHFADIFDYQFTAEMEDDLDKIANGQRKWVPVIQEFYQPFAKKLKSVTKNSERVKVPVEKTGKKCPKCKRGELIIRSGRFGKFIACSAFPECKYTAPFIEQVKGVKCPDCGGKVIIRKTKKGRQFFGCANYPRCKWASWRDPRKVTRSASPGVAQSK